MEDETTILMPKHEVTTSIGLARALQNAPACTCGSDLGERLVGHQCSTQRICTFIGDDVFLREERQNGKSPGFAIRGPCVSPARFQDKHYRKGVLEYGNPFFDNGHASVNTSWIHYHHA